MTMMEIGQRHSGSLFVSPDGSGLRADIEIKDDGVVVSIDGGEAFEYRRDHVRAQVFDSRTVLLDITDDDDLYFAADDPFRFVELALPELQGSRDTAPTSDATETTESQAAADPFGSSSGSNGTGAAGPKTRTGGIAPTQRNRGRVNARAGDTSRDTSSTEPHTTGSVSVTRTSSDKRWRLPVIGTTLPADTEQRRPAERSAKKKRRRSGDRATCQHEWRALNLSGGLVRRVCDDCGYVSIDLSG